MYRTADDLLRSFALTQLIEQKIAHLGSAFSQLEPAQIETTQGIILLGRSEQLLDQIASFFEAIANWKD